jgi:Archaeal DNA polymerase II, large subunit
MKCNKCGAEYLPEISVCRKCGTSLSLARSSGAVTQTRDYIADLERLAGLRDRGIITQVQYEDKKLVLLELIGRTEAEALESNVSQKKSFKETNAEEKGKGLKSPNYAVAILITILCCAVCVGVVAIAIHYQRNIKNLVNDTFFNSERASLVGVTETFGI